MKAIRKHLIQPIVDLWSLIVGLAVTGKFFCGKQVTVHYPRQVVKNVDLVDFRGHVEMIPNPKDPAKSKCIACGMCAMYCPSNCLTVVKPKPPKPTPEEQKAMEEAKARGEKPKEPKAPREPVSFTYDYTLCSLCATCVENCPAGALRFSNDIYLAGTSRKDFFYDLLARLKEQAEKGKKAGGAPKAEAAATAEPAAAKPAS